MSAAGCRPQPGWELERDLWRAGVSPVAGIDEAGRGALAGPVVAAAVILPYGRFPFRDSKAVTPARRERLAAEVRRCALAWGLGEASAAEVDRLDVLRATHLAAARALAALRLPPAGLVTDYLWLEHSGPVRAVPRGEERSSQIAAASLLAKTVRDARMRDLENAFPGYGFGRHKGYGSREHLQALADLGPCEVHRRSFRPVARILATVT